MTDAPGSLEPYSGAVAPTATASGKSSAVVAFATVLKTVVNALPMAFHSENGIIAAENAIDSYVNAHVPASELAVVQGANPGRAAREDVSLRVPPGGAPQVFAGPPLDYNKLAEAILRAQQAQAKSVEG